MALQEEIDKLRSEIRADGYSMSIGEWISLYESKEIDIHPEFQRFFRWTDYQKSRLIESILLGIPIPQIFVAQRQDGVWDVVDGLQRLSTIYQFVGVLYDENDQLIEPLILQPTKYLPSLVGKKWDDRENPNMSFSPTQRLLIKRSKIDVSIILKESDEKSKFELFQRLNTGGSPLSDQEVRNSILVMMNPEIYRWMRRLSSNEDFMECVSLTDRAKDEQYDMDLVLRFLVFRTMAVEEIRKIGDLNEFLSDKMIDMVEQGKIDLDEETRAFEITFSILRESLGSDSFHRYDPNKDKFMGGFLVSAYELVALGVGFNYESLIQNSLDIRQVIKNLWKNQEFTSKSGSGVRASSRLPATIPLGRSAFRP